MTEACEYVESFLTLKPTIALINNIDDDHLDYYENIETYPVKSQVKPGEIMAQLPPAPPAESEDMQAIMHDFERIKADPRSTLK